MAAEIIEKRPRFGDWLSRETEVSWLVGRLSDEPASGLAAWARTSSGIVALLLVLQFVTGILMAFHYVPSANDAYTTVAYLELAVRDGAWLRSLHYHSSVLLPAALVLHLLQMLVRGALASNKTAWFFGIGILCLALAAGATGYALPWDARALNGVSIAASLTGNLPLIGVAARRWLVDGEVISTLTLSRFYALHVWAIPLLIILSVVARLFIFGKKHGVSGQETQDWARKQFARNAVVMGLVFIGLAVFSTAYPAPFGPQAAEASTYLPRPGPQFLWLFELQKYTDGVFAALLALGFPGIMIGGLLVTPLLLRDQLTTMKAAAGMFFVIGFGSVAALTGVALYQDGADPKISAQLARQEADEAKFRASKFEPQFRQTNKPIESSPTGTSLIETASVKAQPISIPSSYAVNCAKCHGASGEGTEKFPELVNLTTREEDQLTPELILAIIDDPKKVGRSSKMPAYKNKLSDDQKQELVTWIRSLSPETGNVPVQTARMDERPN